MFGFGNKFCNTVRMLYRSKSSSVALKQGLTDSFPVNRGISQGCPISPILFIMAAELLAILLKTSTDIEGINIFDKKFIISQFADDTALFLKNEFMVPLASLNVGKCEILPVINILLKTFQLKMK